MFNSPFPPLKPAIKYKTALERAGFDINTSPNKDTGNFSNNKSNYLDSPNSTYVDDSVNSILLVNKSLQKKQKLLMRRLQEDPKNNSNKSKNVLDDLSQPKINAGSSAISLLSQSRSINSETLPASNIKINGDNNTPVSAVFGFKNPSSTAVNNTKSNTVSKDISENEGNVSHISNLNLSNDELAKVTKSKELLLNTKPVQEKKLASELFIKKLKEEEDKKPKEEEFKREITPPIHTINNLADLQDQESFYSDIQSQDPRNNYIGNPSEERSQFVSEQSHDEVSQHNTLKHQSYDDDTFDFNESVGGRVNAESLIDIKPNMTDNYNQKMMERKIDYSKEISESKLALVNEKHIPPAGFKDVVVPKMETLHINDDRDIFDPSGANEHFENEINNDNADEGTGTFFSAKDFVEANDVVEGLNFDSPKIPQGDFDDYEGKTKGIDEDFKHPLTFGSEKKVKAVVSDHIPAVKEKKAVVNEHLPIVEEHHTAIDQHVPVVEENHIAIDQNLPAVNKAPIEISVHPNACRGCLNEIKADEKTISDKNGDLSGKWHKKCFSCKQCNIKFSRTIPCYIHNDEPYCEDHFFDVTGLNCFGCKNRILDDYCLDVMVLGKAHIGCFKCNDCGNGIEDEYFSNKDVNVCVECVRQRGAEEKMQKRRTVLWDTN